MPSRAKVGSTEAIEAFRANLIVYISKARPTLEEISSDVLRVRLWVENNQRAHWEGELRRRSRELEQAQQELFSARMSPIQKESSIQYMMVHRAKRAVDEAQAKLRLIRHWTRNFDNRVQPLLKQTEKLHTVLAHDLGKAVADLTQILATLAAYTEVAAPAQLGGPGAAPSPPNPQATSS